MPKSIIATDLTVESLSMQTDEASTLVGLTAHVNVAYGEARVREQFDIWLGLTNSQRAYFQEVYNTLRQQLQATYLA
ncbi:MAG: hypothetical protein AAB303_06705 [Chloroflexota bacterium]